MKIVVTKKGEPVLEVGVGTRPLVIGRSRESDIVLSHPDVSRSHARVSRAGNRIRIEDLQSVNGVKIAGKRVPAADLSSGESFRLGPFDLSIEESTEEPEAPASSEPADRVLKSFLTDDDPPAPSEPRLVPLDGPDAGLPIPLLAETPTVGGSRVADEKLPSSVSIVKGPEGFLLRDDNEATNTFVDGVPVRERLLENHDRIEIGDARFEFVEGGSFSAAEFRVEKDPTLNTPAFRWRPIVLSGTVVGLLCAAFLMRDRYSEISTLWSPPPTTIPKPTTTPSETENARITLHHLTQARSLLAANNLVDAEKRLDILDTLAPGHGEAAKLRERIAGIRSEEKRKADEAKRKELSRKATLANLLAKGESSLAGGAFASARKSFMELLSLDPGNEAAANGLNRVAAAERERKRGEELRRKTETEMKREFALGLTAFESGQFGEAERILHPLAEKEGSPYRESARKLIAEIRKQTDRKLLDRLAEARKKLEGDDLIPAYEELEKISRQFPANAQAAKLFLRAQQKMTEKAKALFKEGIAQQQLAEDPSAALDKYQEVLLYAPDPKSEYHQKARKKIRELQM